MTKYLFSTFLIFAMVCATQAQTEPSFGIGVSGNYGNYNRFGGDLYFKLKKPSRILRMPAELRAGFTVRSYQLGFDGVEGLEAEALGVYADLVVYPFNGIGFFAGVRAEPFNMNWISEASVASYQNARNDLINEAYSGSCAFLQIGYKQPISKSFAIRLYGQPGVQQFNISNGTSTMGSFVNTSGTANFKKEEQLHFIYNVNLGIEIKF